MENKENLKNISVEEIEAKVKKIINDKLGLEKSDYVNEIKNSDSIMDTLGADSLDTVELVMEFERQLNVSVSDENFESIKTVGDIINYIKDKISKQS